jgi:hypothetical protein
MFEVYVRQAFGTSTSARRVSDHGGVEPRWRRDGKELFYLDANQGLMAVNVRTTPTFETESPTALFKADLTNWPVGIKHRNQYDVAPDGQRFLINAPAGGSPKPLTILVNWPSSLPR